jgi:hypothetical protein
MRLHPTLLTGTFVQRLRKRLCDIATHEGFADHVVDAYGLGRSLSCVPLWPLMKMIEISGRNCRISRANSVPVRSGIVSSVSTRSNRFGSASIACKAAMLESNPSGS